eukprot:1145870-Pelagomonas_calceolata.AAC.3
MHSGMQVNPASLQAQPHLSLLDELGTNRPHEHYIVCTTAVAMHDQSRHPFKDFIIGNLMLNMHEHAHA